MSSAAVTAPLAAPAKSPKRRSKSQKRPAGPTVSVRILKAVSASTDRGGMSLAALKKQLRAGGYDVLKNRARILIALRRLLANKSVVNVKGSGASGSFKAGKKPPAPKRKKLVKKKKPKAKRVRRKSAKAAGAGAGAGATPAAKKSPKKKRRTKSPKKARKPAAARKPKSPGRGAKRRVARPSRSRGAAKK